MPTTDTHAKALEINLDPGIYGSIAEIGAGQEVARWFLSVGGASGTIAQSISAYDKLFSDATYGSGSRYVSEERLCSMLDREYQLLIDRLAPSRGENCRFFAFANSASARNYKGDNEQHAWVGIRFQDEPGSPPNDILLHVVLLDATNALQQAALGTLGVNLIDAAFRRRGSIADFLDGLWDELSIYRMEMDVLRLRGRAFERIDPRACVLQLVRKGLTQAVIFDEKGQVAEPSGILRKRPLLIDRGQFATLERFHHAMLESSEEQLRSENIAIQRDPLSLLELSLQPVEGSPPNDDEVLERIARLVSLGPVVVTNFGGAYLLAHYVRRYTAEPIRFVMGLSLLARLLEDRFYHELPGALLEGLGKLLATNVKLYVYPMTRKAVEEAIGPKAELFREGINREDMVTSDDLIPRHPINHLYRYLQEAGWVVSLRCQ